MSVLDATEWYGETSGGIRTYLLEKARYVAARPSLRHTVLVPGEVDGIHDAQGVRTYRLQGPPIPRHRPYRFMLASRSMSRIVQHERPDVIEVGSPFLAPWILRSVARPLHVPLVSFYHTDVPRVLSRTMRGWPAGRRMLNGLGWRYMRRLDALFPLTIVASDFVARELAAHGIDRVARVPLGVDLERFSPMRRAAATETRVRLGLPTGPLVGFAGRFAREKELDVVLDAWAEIERRTGARLVLAGAGPDEARLRAHPYASRVFFLPFVHDRETLADVLACLDVYVAPGPAETFGLSALEAMACGTPLLSVNTGGVADHVTMSGAGRLYEAGSAASLTEEAITLLQYNLAVLGAGAHAYATDHHSWDVVFARLFEVYREVIAAHHAI